MFAISTIEHVLSVLETVEVFLELAAGRLGGPAARWIVIVAVQVLKLQNITVHCTTSTGRWRGRCCGWCCSTGPAGCCSAPPSRPSTGEAGRPVRPRSQPSTASNCPALAGSYAGIH